MMHSHSQRDFNLAINWVVATGINHKEENYLRTHHTSPVYKILQGCYWIWENEPHVRGEETPLNMEFLLLSFILLGGGLLLSTLMFLLELLHQRCKRRPVDQSEQGDVASTSFTHRETATKILVKERTHPNTIVPDPSRSLANVSENLRNPDSGDTESGTHHINHAIELIEVIE